MTETPPPPPPSEDEGFVLPIPQLEKIAKSWVQWRPLIGWGAKLAGQKIPTELDEFLTAIAGGDEQAVRNLQKFAEGQQNPQGRYNIQQQEIPEPRIGEPVLTQDLAWRAYQLHHEQGLSLREIAAYFTNELGAPCSHATIANYINEIDEVMEENKGARTKTLLKVFGFVAMPIVVGLLIGHFLL